jgi:endonuclease/exonuclease/phosphatase (EEP) superfamily protein YafD
MHRVAMIVRAPEWLRLRRADDRWWHVLATLAAVLATTIAVVALCLHAFSTSWQFTILLAAVSHQLMWAAPIGLLVAITARRWATAVVASVACVLVGYLQIPAQLGATHAVEGRELIVLQANLKVGGADPDALTQLVRDHQVDILATEELTTAEEQGLIEAGLPALLPHRYTAPLADGGGGLGMWSRFPLSDTHNLPGYSAGVLTARVGVPGAELTFVALHLSPPFRQPIEVWRTEIADLRATLAGLPSGAPVIAAGDFNATVDHAQFRGLLTGGYHDAADDAGAGYLPTYPDDRWWGPLIGIDHVLTRGAAVARSADTFSVPNSDHRALLVDVVLH